MMAGPQHLDRARRPRLAVDWGSDAARRRMTARYRSERLLKLLGLASLGLAGLFLGFLLFTIAASGLSGFQRTDVRVMVAFDPVVLRIDPVAANKGDRTVIAAGDFAGLMMQSAAMLGAGAGAVSDGAWIVLRDMAVADPSVIGTRRAVWVPVRSDIDLLAKGKIDASAPSSRTGISDADLAAYRALQGQGALRTGFNADFLVGGDSTDPELAGIGGAIIGSLLTMLVVIVLSFPIGIAAAIYLEEFAGRSRATALVEASISNLAAVPSIIFGLLGLAVFLNIFNLPRSAPLVGGLTLALMTLPVIIITARLAIRAVPVSIRDGALAIGASPLQMMFGHVVPVALPGIMTGTIIGMGRALGETAPLLLIGMRAFVVDAPRGLASPATALPVQIFLWSDAAQRGFVEKTSAAIIVLLIFLLALNSVAIVLRNRSEGPL
jgi:phosphate transport system permease protein